MLFIDEDVGMNCSTSSRKSGAKSLKTKTVQSALARMSNMFMGTLTVKGPKSSTAIGIGCILFM